MKTFSILLFPTLLLLSGSPLSPSLSECCGTCYGYTNCTACKNCKYCRHCNSGGTCGVCNGGGSRRSYTPSGSNKNTGSSSGGASKRNNDTYKPAAATITARAAIVAVDKLNVRKGPGTGYGILLTLNRNEEVDILESTGESWILIQATAEHNGVIYKVKGYVYRKYLKIY